MNIFLCLKVTTNGEMTPIELKYNSNLEKLNNIYKELNCDFIECVHPKRLHDEFIIICDEEFSYKENPIINPYASWLYKADEHRNYICGDVLICKEIDTTEGKEIISMNDDEISFQMLAYTVRKNEINKFIKDTIKYIKSKTNLEEFF